jgi:hypothetical protein
VSLASSRVAERLRIQRLRIQRLRIQRLRIQLADHGSLLDMGWIDVYLDLV